MQGPLLMFVIAGGAILCIMALALMVFLMTRKSESPTSGLPSSPPTFKIPMIERTAIKMFNSTTDCPQAARWMRVTLMDILKEFDDAYHTVRTTALTPGARAAALQQAFTVVTARALQSIEELRACKPGATLDGKNIADLIKEWEVSRGSFLNLQLPRPV